MNVLSMGVPFGQSDVPVRLFRSKRGHEVRILGTGSEADYRFNPGDTAADIVSRVSRDWAPDLLLCWLPELVPPPQRIEACPIKTVAIVSDWNLHYPKLERNLARYDIVLTDRLGAETLRPPGAAPRFFAPIYSHASTVHRVVPTHRDIDVAFVGNLNHAIHVRRARCLERLAGLSDRYRVLVCGGYFGEEYARLLSRTRIVFNYSVRREMNLRCFEAPACGALLFLEEDNLEAPQWLHDRRDIVYYRPDNLVELVTYYLEHDEEREAIACRGRSRIERLAGEFRLDDLIDWLAAQPIGARPFTGFAPWEQPLADMMQYALDDAPDPTGRLLPELTHLAEQYPDRPAFAALLSRYTLGLANAAEGHHREGYLRMALHWAKEACTRAPDSVPLWLNLSAACSAVPDPRLDTATLEQALASRSCVHGNLLVGTWDDPYYVNWSGALARRRESVEMLWSIAATRLAQRLLDTGRFEDVERHATRAIEWSPDVPVAYRIRAQARSRAGNPEAAAQDLETSLPLTAFNVDHRRALIEAWQALGRQDDARALSRSSARIFDACPDAPHVAHAFRRILE